MQQDLFRKPLVGENAADEMMAVMHHCPQCETRTLGSYVNHAWNPFCPDCACLKGGMIRAFEDGIVYRKQCQTCGHLGPAGPSYQEAEALAWTEEFVGDRCVTCLKKEEIREQPEC